jgi:NitT/TauT family transport system substrate-binding protein
MAFSRRKFVIGGSLMLASTRLAAARTPRLPIRVASSLVNAAAPLLYAQSSGHFREAGLDVTIEKMTSGSEVAEAIAAGAVDVGLVSTVPILNAYAKGVGLVILFPTKIHIQGSASDSALVVRPDSPIRSAKDFNGKTVSCSALKDIAWLGARAWLDQNGADSSTVAFTEIPFSAVASALAAPRRRVCLRRSVSGGRCT